MDIALVIGSITAALISLITGWVVHLSEERKKKRREDIRKELSKVYSEKFNSYYDEILKRFDFVKTSPKGNIIVYEVKKSPLEGMGTIQLEFPEGTSTADVERIVGSKTNDIKKRLDLIESITFC